MAAAKEAPTADAVLMRWGLLFAVVGNHSGGTFSRQLISLCHLPLHMTQQSAQDFLAYCEKHIKGDEKGEAQIFLDHLFTALGYADGLKGAGASRGSRVAQASSRRRKSIRDGNDRGTEKYETPARHPVISQL